MADVRHNLPSRNNLFSKSLPCDLKIISSCGLNSSQWYSFDVCTGRVFTIEHLPCRGQIQKGLKDGNVMITTQEMFEKVGFKIEQT